MYFQRKLLKVKILRSVKLMDTANWWIPPIGVCGEPIARWLR